MKDEETKTNIFRPDDLPTVDEKPEPTRPVSSPLSEGAPPTVPMPERSPDVDDEAVTKLASSRQLVPDAFRDDLAEDSVTMPRINAMGKRRPQAPTAPLSKRDVWGEERVAGIPVIAPLPGEARAKATTLRIQEGPPKSPRAGSTPPPLPEKPPLTPRGPGESGPKVVTVQAGASVVTSLPKAPLAVTLPEAPASPPPGSPAANAAAAQLARAQAEVLQAELARRVASRPPPPPIQPAPQPPPQPQAVAPVAAPVAKRPPEPPTATSAPAAFVWTLAICGLMSATGAALLGYLRMRHLW